MPSAARLGLRKIKTTGDGYMVAGGAALAGTSPDHAPRLPNGAGDA